MSPSVFCFVLVLSVAALTVVQGDSYDETRARKYAMYASISYCGADSIRTWTCQWCTQINPKLQVSAILQNNTYDSFGFAGYDQETGDVVVVFRGTQPTDIVNWIQDLKAAKATPYFAPNARVHLGFLESYQSLAEQTKMAVAGLLTTYPGANLVVVGHSLGGAEAVLFAADYANIYSNIHLWTMGCPRVGNQEFAGWFDSLHGVQAHWRIVNDDDVVPHLPTEAMGFHHTTTEVWYTDSTNHKICSSSNGEDPNCSDSVFLPASVYDHTHYFGIVQLCN